MDIKVINEYIFKKHNIIPGTQLDNIPDIARNHLGLHSARIMTPYATLCSRLKEYSPNMLTSQLYKEKKLIKMRCMRTTLHIVPHDIAGILHLSTLDMRLGECKLFFRRNKISLDFINDLEFSIIESQNAVKPAREIEENILKNIDFVDSHLRKECTKKILKYFWEKGVLCYVNVANNWEKEDRRYALTKFYYPNLNFKKYDIERAQEMLVLEYICKFGPATTKDITWWSGLSYKIVKKAIDSNKDQIEKLTVKDFDHEFYFSKSESDKIIGYQKVDFEWVSLLAYEDPSLKGYYESRFRYVDKAFYNQVFNQIGEVRASIIYNGKAIGIWEWDKKKRHINLNYFSLPRIDIQNKIDQLREKFESMLYTNSINQLSVFDAVN